jgi:uncharacterized protein YggE
VSFSENGGGYYPTFAKGFMAVAESTPREAPEIPLGENKISAYVSITYEIR